MAILHDSRVPGLFESLAALTFMIAGCAAIVAFVAMVSP